MVDFQIRPMLYDEVLKNFIELDRGKRQAEKYFLSTRYFVLHSTKPTPYLCISQSNTNRAMKTWILILGFLLLANAGFSMGHPHNIFAARQRLVARLQAVRQTPTGSVARSLPAKPTESPMANYHLPFRQILPGRALRFSF